MRGWLADALEKLDMTGAHAEFIAECEAWLADETERHRQGRRGIGIEYFDCYPGMSWRERATVRAALHFWQLHLDGWDDRDRSLAVFSAIANEAGPACNIAEIEALYKRLGSQRTPDSDEPAQPGEDEPAIIWVRQDGTIDRRDFPANQPVLDKLQEWVGGYIEHVGWPRLKFEGMDVELFCNEEGKLKGMPINPLGSRIIDEAGYTGADVFVGPLVLFKGCTPE